jgi:lysozyme
MDNTINLMVVDLSHFEAEGFEIDYNKILAAGVVGVIYKATQGLNYTDHTYNEQRTAAKAAGLLWGSYHFGTNDDPIQQAVHYFAFASPTEDEIFALDWEDNESQMTTDQAKAFITSIETTLSRPNRCILYSGNVLKENLNGPDEFFSARRLWLCDYNRNPKLPLGFSETWLWQYTDGQDGPGPYTTPGLPSGGVDCNSYTGTLEQLKANWAELTMKKKKLNKMQEAEAQVMKMVRAYEGNFVNRNSDRIGDSLQADFPSLEELNQDLTSSGNPPLTPEAYNIIYTNFCTPSE